MVQLLLPQLLPVPSSLSLPLPLPLPIPMSLPLPHTPPRLSTRRVGVAVFSKKSDSADGWLAGADGRFLRLMPRRPARARAVETKENREFPFAESNAVYRRSAVPDHFDCFTRR